MPILAGLHYRQYGKDPSAPALLLIHGAGGEYLAWPSAVRRLAGCRVYAIDLPGHGASPGEGLDSIAVLAQAVLGWIEALALPPAVVAGHSMGSGVAMQLAHSAPQRVRGLALLGSAPRLPVNPVLLQAAADPRSLPAAVEKIVQWSFGPSTPSALRAQVGQRMLAMRPGVLHADLLACNRFDPGAYLPQINVPALLISGALDKMTPASHAQSLQQALPNARLQVLEDTGHMLMLERPLQVAGALAAFIASLQPA